MIYITCSRKHLRILQKQLWPEEKVKIKFYTRLRLKTPEVLDSDKMRVFHLTALDLRKVLDRPQDCSYQMVNGQAIYLV